MVAWVDVLRLLTQPELTEGPAEGRSKTREIKDGHSSRPVGGAEMGGQGGEGSRCHGGDLDWRSVGGTGQAV